MTESFKGKTWVTHVPLWPDRLASAWLIVRHIDHDAKVLCVAKNDPIPRSALTFCFDGARFSHSAVQLAFETLQSNFNLSSNLALGKIAILIRSIEGVGNPVSEGPGVKAMLDGAKRRSATERDLLDESLKTFDLLYEAYREEK